MILLYDNYDSFTYNLLDYLEQLGAECIVVRNDEKSLEELQSLNFNGIVISPGPGRPKDAGNLMQLIKHYHQVLPILGICLGQQAIGEYFGAQLVKAKNPMHGKTSLIKHQQHAMFKDVPLEFNAMRYHSLILENLPNELIATASSSENEIMAIAHQQYAIWALQFHPESILSEYGMTMLNNWLSEFKLLDN